MQQTLQGIKIGNANSTKTIKLDGPGCRWFAQFKAICDYHKENPSAWWCINPFEAEPDGKIFNCTFAHTYFGIDGSLHMIQVTPTGKIKTLPEKVDEYTGRWKAETDAVVAQYGAFSGAGENEIYACNIK